MLAEPLAVTLQVIDVLDMLNVPYWIGGSLAVAVHGVARSTLDTDLVAYDVCTPVDLLLVKLEWFRNRTKCPLSG